MDSDQQATPVPHEQAAAPMPSAEQTQPEAPVAPPVVEPQPQEAEGPASPTLPDGVKERTTNEFEKLRGQLREERAKREYAESVFQQLAPKPQLAEQPRPTPIVDPTSGLIDPIALTNLQQQSQSAADRAKQAEDKLVAYQLQQEKKEAYGAHPELNPDARTYNKELAIEARRILTDNLVHPEDYDHQQLSLKEAADMVKAKFQPALDKATQAGATQAIERITPKEQAALEVTGSPSGAQRLTDDEQTRLSLLTRKGGDDGLDAIIARMKGR